MGVRRSLSDPDDRSRSATPLFLAGSLGGRRWLVRAGAPWPRMPSGLPPGHLVYDQTQRWLRAGVFEATFHDLRLFLRLAAPRPRTPRRPLLYQVALCRSGPQRAKSSRDRQGAGAQVGRDQAAGDEEGRRAVAAALSGRTEFCLKGRLPELGTRL
jgi:transposase